MRVQEAGPHAVFRRSIGGPQSLMHLPWNKSKEAQLDLLDTEPGTTAPDGYRQGFRLVSMRSSIGASFRALVATGRFRDLSRSIGSDARSLSVSLHFRIPGSAPPH